MSTKEASLETVEGPLKVDRSRRKWSSNKDFYYACVSHAFNINFFTLIPFGNFVYGSFGFFLPVLLNIIFFNVPIFFIQSYLGQFSSSGFISAFRIVPLFKCIGYIILILNLTSVTYLSSQAALSLLYTFNSLRQLMPWMNCDVSRATHNYFDYEEETCDVTRKSVKEYFEKVVGIDSEELNFSWDILGLMIVVWLTVAVILSISTEKIGRILRWMCITMFVLLFAIFLRTLFLPATWKSFNKIFTIQNFYDLKIGSIFTQSVMCSLIMGTSWGSVITLASYNNFRSNICKSSWTVNGSLLGIIMITGLTSLNLEPYNELIYDRSNALQLHATKYVYQNYPYTLGKIELPNLWTFLFFALIFLCELSAIVIQTFGILTALFDEFEELRKYKLKFTYTLISILILPSILFCTNYGYEFIYILGRYEILTQTSLCLLTLIVVMWIYNRSQLQRDIQFMTFKNFETWKIYLIRMVSPVCIFIFLCFGVWYVKIDVNESDELQWIIIGFCLETISFIIIPIYVVVKFFKTSGSFTLRFKRMVQPTDWYPADKIDKSRYDDTFGDFSGTLMDEQL